MRADKTNTRHLHQSHQYETKQFITLKGSYRLKEFMDVCVSVCVKGVIGCLE